MVVQTNPSTRNVTDSGNIQGICLFNPSPPPPLFHSKVLPPHPLSSITKPLSSTPTPTCLQNHAVGWSCLVRKEAGEGGGVGCEGLGPFFEKWQIRCEIRGESWKGRVWWVGGLEGGCGMFFYCYLHKGLCINVLIFSTIFGLCSLDSNGKGFRCILLL